MQGRGELFSFRFSPRGRFSKAKLRFLFSVNFNRCIASPDFRGCSSESLTEFTGLNFCEKPFLTWWKPNEHFGGHRVNITRSTHISRHMRQVISKNVSKREFETSPTRLVVDDRRYFAMLEISHHIARKDQRVVSNRDYRVDRTLKSLFEQLKKKIISTGKGGISPSRITLAQRQLVGDAFLISRTRVWSGTIGFLSSNEPPSIMKISSFGRMQPAACVRPSEVFGRRILCQSFFFSRRFSTLSSFGYTPTSFQGHGGINRAALPVRKALWEFVGSWLSFPPKRISLSLFSSATKTAPPFACGVLEQTTRSHVSFFGEKYQESFKAVKEST